MNLLVDVHPWTSSLLYHASALRLKQADELPAYIAHLSGGTAAYEQAIRTAWTDFKRQPSAANADKFADFLISFSSTQWPEVMAAILGVESLTPAQRKVLEEALSEHHEYIKTSLLPDITRIAARTEGRDERLASLDYRTVFLYAGALWAFGSLATIMFDGLSVRDLADVFLFAGPNDSHTCTGERGCEQYVGKFLTVAEILADNILPGRLRCLTNCRHMLLPIASPLKKKRKKHLPGRHDQGTHAPHTHRPKMRALVAPKGADGSIFDAGENGAHAFNKYFNGRAGVDFEEPYNIPLEVQKELKKEAALTIAASSGLPAKAVAAAIKIWQKNANDNSLWALSMQQVAAEEFGTELSEYQQERLGKAIKFSENFSSTGRGYRSGPNQWAFETLETEPSNFLEFEALQGNVSGAHSSVSKEHTRRLLQGMYEETQKKLKDLGIEYITVYRGSQSPLPEGATIGSTLELEQNALESYSTSRPIASSFGYNVIKTIVPVERVLAIPGSGFGCAGEYEVVVISGEGDMVTVVESYE